MFFGSFIKRNKPLSLFIILSLVCLISIGFSTKKIVASPAKIGMSIVNGIQKGFSGVGGFFSATFTSIGELAKLKEQNETLRARLKDLETVEKDFIQLKEENQRLVTLLDFSKQLRIQNIPAEVVAKDPQDFFSTIVINKGLVHGISESDPVIAHQNGEPGLVGKIVNVTFYSSSIMPIYDRYSYVAARLQKSRFEGLTNGQGSSINSIIMQYVRKSAKDYISFGDVIVTSGLRSIYPRDIKIGQVKRIKAREYDSSLELEVTPFINFAKLEHVFVLKVGEQ